MNNESHQTFHQLNENKITSGICEQFVLPICRDIQKILKV